MFLRTIIIITFLYSIQIQLNADFSPDYHVFGSQSYIHSSKGDYVREDTKRGSFDYQEIGVNVADEFINNKLYLGVQGLGRRNRENKLKFDIDWAKISYLFDDNLKVSAGLLKNIFGFYNETRDIDATRSMAFAPQEIYDERSRDYVFSSYSIRLDGNVEVAHYGDLNYSINYGALNMSNSSTTSQYIGSLFSNQTEYDKSSMYGMALEYDFSSIIQIMLQREYIHLDYKFVPKPLPGLLPGGKALEMKYIVDYFGFRYNAVDWSVTSELMYTSGDQTILGTIESKVDSLLTINLIFDYYYSQTTSLFSKIAHLKQEFGQDKLYDNTVCFGVNYRLKEYWQLKAEYNYFTGGMLSFEPLPTNSVSHWDALVLRVSFSY